VIRNNVIVFDGKLSSLKRFKDDVRDVAQGYECGIAIEGFPDLQTGDFVESYHIEKVATKLTK
jgi:translation initiation factor IF-2